MTFSKKSDYGRCFICREHVPSNELISLRNQVSAITTEVYFICEFCHIPLWHNCGGNNSLMCESLRKFANIQNKYKTKDEMEDKARKKEGKVSIENVADLAWELRYNEKEFFTKLGS